MESDTTDQLVDNIEKQKRTLTWMSKKNVVRIAENLTVCLKGKYTAKDGNSGMAWTKFQAIWACGT